MKSRFFQMDNSVATFITSEAGNTSASKIGSRSFWMAFCLTIPVVSKIILPSSFELLLEIHFGGIPIYFPNLLVLYFFIGSKKNGGDKILKTILFLQIVFMLVGFVYSQYIQESLALLMVGNYYYYAIILGLACRLTLQERYWVERIYSFTLFILGFEVILLGLGIVEGFGETIVADEAQSFDDFFRVSTTAGAATGTAVHLYLLTVICILLSNSPKWRIALFVFGLSTTALTVSRGGTAAFLLYFVLWMFYKTKDNRNNRLKMVFGVLTAIALLYYVGVFNPLMKRIEIKTQDGTMMESREDRAEVALQIYDINADSKLLGLGHASLFRSPEMRHMGVDNVVAPHNSYVQTLCEQGIIGLTLMLLFWFTFICINRSNKAILISILPLLLVIWNTESVAITLSDYLISLAILLMLALDKEKQYLLHTI